MEGVKYKIGEVASMLATSIRTIRYYEEESLLNPTRTYGGTRLYSEKNVERLKAILHLVRNGFTIESIRAIGNTRERCKTGDESSKKIEVIFNETLADLEKQIQALVGLKKEINSAKKIIKKCSGCNNIPSTNGCPGCLVPTKLREIGLLNLVWEDEQQ